MRRDCDMRLNHKAFALSFPADLAVHWVRSLLRPADGSAAGREGCQRVRSGTERVSRLRRCQALFTGLQSDDWIALDEGSWFYMPTLYPAASFSQAMQVLQTQDVLIGQIPEVKDVLGKIGRVESALDPAPAAMVETYVMLKPESEWREGVTARDVWDEINRVATLPGVTPASALQPIEGRVVMLQSGIKAPMAIRIYGDELEDTGRRRDGCRGTTEEVAATSTRVRSIPTSCLGKPYIEFTVDREAASRYGMSASMVNQVIETALGGMNLIKTVEGRERYPVRLRYNRDLRERIDGLRRLPVVTHSGAVVPLEELAKLETTWGPGAINSENGRLVAHVAFMTNGSCGRFGIGRRDRGTTSRGPVAAAVESKSADAPDRLFARSGGQLSQSDRSQLATDVDHPVGHVDQPAVDLHGVSQLADFVGRVFRHSSRVRRWHDCWWHGWTLN